MFILKPVWRERGSSGRVFRPDPGSSVHDVAERPEVAEAVLVEQLGAEAEEGDGDHTEHRHDDRQRELHAIALSGMVNGHH